MTINKINIGYFTTQYPYPDQFQTKTEYFCSGAERVAKNLAETVADDTYNASVVTSSDSMHYETKKQNGVTVYRSPSIHTINTMEFPPTLPIDQLSREFDIVHAHNSTPPGIFAGAVYAAVNNVPFIITHHGGENYEKHGGLVRRAGLYFYTRWLINMIFNQADVVVSPSAGYVQESDALSNYKGELRMIPNGIDITPYTGLSQQKAKRKLGIDPSEVLILYLGSHHARKGVHILLNAFSLLNDSVSFDTNLILAGSGQMTDSLQQTTVEKEMGDDVYFPGFILEENKPLYMTAADLFILPTITPAAEMYPLVILEAAAGGTPVIASDFPTLRSIIEPNGIGELVESGNAAVLAETMSKILTDPTTLKRISENARQFAEQRQWPLIADEYVRLYETLL